MDRSRFGIKVVLGLVLLALLVAFWSIFREETEKKVIKAQLEAIQEKRMTEAYYGFTSKDFQAATSLDDFKKFISNFPLFSESTSSALEDSGKPGLINVTLKGAGEQLNLHYTLRKDSSWKVQGIEVVKEDAALKNLPEFDESIFLEPVKSQIKSLKKGNNKDAYHRTADAFQVEIPFEKFDKFVKSFPIFINYETVKYDKLTFNNNLGIYSVRLIAKNGDVFDVSYDLIKEKGTWKILQIQISDTPKKG